MSVLVTGAAGFIGFHLSKRLIESGISVVGYDNLNPYYDVSLKEDRVKNLAHYSESSSSSFDFVSADLEDKTRLDSVFSDYHFDAVVNLAAQAGVRYSIDNPSSYIQSNLVGFANLLECCRHSNIKHFIYASSSSVYGGNTQQPFSEAHSVDHPISLYAATKKSNELMAHSYSHLYGLPTTGLRFFTVYGPWGRPDMALFLFTKAMLENRPIKVFNNGDMVRDFTFIDDIIESIVLLLDHPPVSNPSFDTFNPDPSTSWCPYRIFNIGNSTPIPLMDYIHAIERCLGTTANIVFHPLQPGDVTRTCADTSLLSSWVGFKPSTSVNDGVAQFVSWYKSYYSIQ